MINLLPPASKQDIKYARRNNVLYKWILAVGAAILGIIIITISGIIYLQIITSSVNKSTAVTDKIIQDQKLTEPQKELQTLSDNFKTVVKLLSSQVLFSKLLPKIATILPPNTSLGAISLTDQTSTGVDIVIKADSREDANQAFANINNPKNGLFDKADLVSITCSDSDESSSTANEQKCTANIRATFSPSSKIIFLNSLGVK